MSLYLSVHDCLYLLQLPQVEKNCLSKVVCLKLYLHENFRNNEKKYFNIIACRYNQSFELNLRKTFTRNYIILNKRFLYICSAFSRESKQYIFSSQRTQREIKIASTVIDSTFSHYAPSVTRVIFVLSDDSRSRRDVVAPSVSTSRKNAILAKHRSIFRSTKTRSIVKGSANIVNERARLGTSVRFVSRERA